MSQFFTIGKVVKSHGLRGEIKVLSLTNQIERFYELQDVYILFQDHRREPVVVEKVRLHKKTVILKLEGVNHREDSDALVGSLLQVDEEHLMRLPEDAYYVHDLIGLTVVTDTGHLIGEITEVWNMPANDVCVVNYQGKEVLLPFIDDVVLSIDLAEKKMMIHLMEGLLD